MTEEQTNNSNQRSLPKNELIFGFVAAVGVDLDYAEEVLEAQLTVFGYKTVRIRVSKDILAQLDPEKEITSLGYYERTKKLMDIGDNARKSQAANEGPKNFNVVALGVASLIQKRRKEILAEFPNAKIAYLVHSLKHPHEVRTLRAIYPRGFYLIGIHVPGEARLRYLMGKNRKLVQRDAESLMKRDKQSKDDHGQKLVDTFHLADFFAGWPDTEIEEEINNYKTMFKNSLIRFLEVVFGHPNRTPTFGEYAMYLAFSAALRSADLSRQVGAVLTKDREILGTGANDCPKPLGGLYWPDLNTTSFEFEDSPNGRDYMRKDPQTGLGYDSNRKELVEIKESVLNDAHKRFLGLLKDNSKHENKIPDPEQLAGKLRKELSRVLEDSPIRDLTEFGRVVHAEMEALLSCARKGVSTKGSSLFSTTFPCHNCAKHIIASGVERVIFIEPYLKSKAMDMFRDDAIELSFPAPLSDKAAQKKTKVQFQPFVGIGPRRFMDLFSMEIGTGSPLDRRDGSGKVRARKWLPEVAEVRIGVAADSYLDRENEAVNEFRACASNIGN